MDFIEFCRSCGNLFLDVEFCSLQSIPYDRCCLCQILSSSRKSM